VARYVDGIVQPVAKTSSSTGLVARAVLLGGLVAVEARFFRFTALRDVERSGWANVAEITVLLPTASQ
jgi:hypothetical protein